MRAWSALGRSWRAQQFHEPLLAEIEDPFHITAHHQSVCQLPQHPKGQRVMHLILYSGPTVFRDEAVLVPPQSIRSANLGIDETVRRTPLRNLADPAHGKAAHAQAILDS